MQDRKVPVVNLKTEQIIKHRQKILCIGQLTSMGVLGIYSNKEVYFCINLKETRNSYFCVTPKNQLLQKCALIFFKLLKKYIFHIS